MWKKLILAFVVTVALTAAFVLWGLSDYNTVIPQSTVAKVGLAVFAVGVPLFFFGDMAWVVTQARRLPSKE